MSKISIIVPVYNVEQYLERSLNSLVNQTLKDIEIIVVNDGSTDNSQKIIERFKEKFPDKIVSLQKENGGLSDARNFGMKYAKSKYIAFLDSDDYVKEEMYERMYEKIVEDDSDMVECDFYWVYPNKIRKDVGEIYNDKKEMMVKARVIAWNKLIRKEIIDVSKVKFPNGYRYEDTEFFYKILPYINKVSFVKEPFIYYIQRKNSISNSQNERTKEIFDVLGHVIDYYKEKNIYDEYKDEIEYTYTRYLLCSSFLRMRKIKNKKTRKELLNKTWKNLNMNFPNWKKNKILKTSKGMKNLYMKTMNKILFEIYCIKM